MLVIRQMDRQSHDADAGRGRRFRLALAAFVICTYHTGVAFGSSFVPLPCQQPTTVTMPSMTEEAYPAGTRDLQMPIVGDKVKVGTTQW